MLSDTGASTHKTGNTDNPLDALIGEAQVDFDQAVSGLDAEQPVKRIKMEDIKRTVAEHFNLAVSEMVSPKRAYAISHPRQIAMYLCRLLTPRSLPEIGRKFNRDHTTVMHALKRVPDRAAQDAEMDAAIRAIYQKLCDRPLEGDLPVFYPTPATP